MKLHIFQVTDTQEKRYLPKNRFPDAPIFRKLVFNTVITKKPPFFSWQTERLLATAWCLVTRTWWQHQEDQYGACGYQKNGSYDQSASPASSVTRYKCVWFERLSFYGPPCLPTTTEWAETLNIFLGCLEDMENNAFEHIGEGFPNQIAHVTNH